MMNVVPGAAESSVLPAAVTGAAVVSSHSNACSDLLNLGEESI